MYEKSKTINSEIRCETGIVNFASLELAVIVPSIRIFMSKTKQKFALFSTGKELGP